MAQDLVWGGVKMGIMIKDKSGNEVSIAEVKEFLVKKEVVDELHGLLEGIVLAYQTNDVDDLKMLIKQADQRLDSMIDKGDL